ncbi:MAG: DUF2207 domain-containing protein [Candidatus Doudnabacteria bacterium]
MKKILGISIFLGILALPLLALAQTQERIVSFDSAIKISQDASMEVTETIHVISSGDQIQHGIYRDFPIAYSDRLGHRYMVGFHLLGVSKNGSPEPYHTQRAGNGIRIYIGSQDVSIPPGEYDYTISYKTDRQLGFFGDHDELYWNVTGNGWVFPIDKVTAKVTLPKPVPKEQITAALYTGAQGSTAQEGTAQITDGGAEFSSTASLGSYEGLTIVVGWPKGIVTPPSKAENFRNAISSNLDYIIGILGFIIILGYFLFVWNKFGRDPKKNTIIAQYEPPQGFSPAFLRYIQRMGTDSRNFASAIIDLGVKGRLKITEEKGFLGKTSYTLTKTAEKQANLPQEEKLLEDGFFALVNIFQLETENATVISKVRQDFANHLTLQAGKKYFSKNVLALALGIFLSIVTVVGVISASVITRYSVGSALQMLFLPVLVLAFLSLNIIFARLLRAYTEEGRRLTDEIEGFKLFLSVTEKDRLAFHNPPDKTPELFERMLPYALALGVEHEWAQQFADVFAKLEKQGVVYSPVWYYGSFAHFAPDDFASSLGHSFTGVVASSSTPPGSSSGFSGGGFSGGGGGGGGGGGW